MEAWSDVLIGITIPLLAIYIYKFIEYRKIWNNGIYPGIYANYLEYFFKKNKMKRMSKSAWIESKLGKHRILYYVDESNTKAIHAFVLLICKKGMILINLCNSKGEIKISKANKSVVKKLDPSSDKVIMEDIENPFTTLESANRRITTKLKENAKITLNIATFFENCDVEMNMELPKNYKYCFIPQLVDTIETAGLENVYSDDEIDSIYNSCLSRLYE